MAAFLIGLRLVERVDRLRHLRDALAASLSSAASSSPHACTKRSGCQRRLAVWGRGGDRRSSLVRQGRAPPRRRGRPWMSAARIKADAAAAVLLEAQPASSRWRARVRAAPPSAERRRRRPRARLAHPSSPRRERSVAAGTPATAATAFLAANRRRRRRPRRRRRRRRRPGRPPDEAADDVVWTRPATARPAEARRRSPRVPRRAALRRGAPYRRLADGLHLAAWRRRARGSALPARCRLHLLPSEPSRRMATRLRPCDPCAPGGAGRIGLAPAAAAAHARAGVVDATGTGAGARARGRSRLHGLAVGALESVGERRGAEGMVVGRGWEGFPRTTGGGRAPSAETASPAAADPARTAARTAAPTAARWSAAGLGTTARAAAAAALGAGDGRPLTREADEAVAAAPPGGRRLRAAFVAASAAAGGIGAARVVAGDGVRDDRHGAPSHQPAASRR